MLGVIEGTIGAGVYSLISKISSIVARKYQVSYHIRRAIDEHEEISSSDDEIIKSMKQVFGSKGLLDTIWNNSLSDIGDSGILDHLIMTFGTDTDIEVSKKLVEYIFLSRNGSPDECTHFSETVRLALQSSFDIFHNRYQRHFPDTDGREREKRLRTDARRSATLLHDVLNALQDGHGEWVQDTNFSPDFVSKKIVEHFDPLKNYVERLNERLNGVDVHGSSGEIVNVELDSIYVDVPVSFIPREGNFQSYSDLRNFLPREEVAENWYDVANYADKTVLLGDPGGGKSTLSKKICLEISRAFGNNSNRLPVFLELRRYIARIVEVGDISLGNYILEEIKSYNIGEIDDTIDASILYHLRIGSAFIVADGLDEVLTPSNRSIIVREIRTFSKNFPLATLLVTSRYVGYETQPLIGFDHLGVDHLSPEAITNIYRNVSKIVLSKSEKDIKDSENIFIKDANYKASELITSPLLLTLIVIVYSKKSEIPDNRANLYAACADLLFERWDAFRNIWPNLPERYRLFDLFKELAYILYEKVEYGGRIGKDDLLIEAKNFFRQDYVDNKEGRASESAKLMVDHLTGRAWILHEVGENIFEFTHRTFLEFFYARYLETSFESTDDLVDRCLEYVRGGTRTIPAHLALQIRTKDKRIAATTVATKLTSSINDTGHYNHELTRFSVESLDYILPNALALHELASAISQKIFKNGNASTIERFLCTGSPMRSTILQGSIDALRMVNTVNIIRRVSPSLRRLNKEDRSSFCKDDGEYISIDDLVLDQSFGKQMSSPFLCKLAFDLDNNINWNAIKKHNFRLWGSSGADLRYLIDDSIQIVIAVRNKIENSDESFNKYLLLGEILRDAINMSVRISANSDIRIRYYAQFERIVFLEALGKCIVFEINQKDTELLAVASILHLEVTGFFHEREEILTIHNILTNIKSKLADRHSIFYNWLDEWMRNERYLLLPNSNIQDSISKME